MGKNVQLEGIEKQLLEKEGDGENLDILDLIRTRVNELLEKDPELLMSYLYRLDILEEKLKFVLSKESPLPIAEGFSLLIFERQKQRVETKKKYKQKPIDGWEY